MRLSPVLGDDDLPAVELQALRLDGELFPLADGWCSVDELEGPAQRARAALGSRSPRLIAELATAAWVWGACDTVPRPREFCADLAARARLAPNPFAVVREVVLDPDDVVRLDGTQVTTPVRTAVDLARFRTTIHEADLAVIARLAAVGGFGLAQCHELMDRRRNLPEKRRAALRLAAVLR